jgi:hypothetical protein
METEVELVFEILHVDAGCVTLASVRVLSESSFADACVVAAW